MAKKLTYAERNQRSIERTGKTEYQRRIERGEKIGLSRPQTRGHARPNEPTARQVIQQIKVVQPERVRPARPPSQRPVKPKRIQPPPVTQKRVQGPRNSEQVTSTSIREIAKELKAVASASADARVYFSFWDKDSGTWKYMYKGKYDHGITASYLQKRIDEKLRNGDAKTPREAFLQVVQEDIDYISDNENDSDGMEAIPSPLSQVRIHILSH